MNKRAKTGLVLASAVAMTVIGGQVFSADKKPAPAKPAAPITKAGEGTLALTAENLAAGKTATASSYQNDGLKADMAVDGDPGTRWCADGDVVPSWLQVDLGKAEDLTGVGITWEKEANQYAYKVEVSADGKAWNGLAANEFKADEFAKFDAKGVRYVRVTITGLKPGAWPSIKELKVHGTKLVAAADQKKPAKTAGVVTPAAVKAPAGFDVTIFAAPPELNYPTTVHASPNGDVFVGIDEQGSLGREKGRGRVVRLRDTNNDGKADEFVDVAKMDNPRGVWVDGDDLYVLHPPFFTKYKMGPDGKATSSEVLVSGVSTEPVLKSRGADHTTNGFRVGPDGWAYIAMGDFGAFKAVGKDGKSIQMHGGGVVRVRLDGSDIEDYSFGQRNIYDVAIDPFGTVFTRDNTNDGGGWNVRLSHVIPTGNYGYPRLFIRFGDEIVQPLNDYGGGSPCGALWVDEPGVPAIAQGLLTVEWGASKVWHHPLTPSGAGYAPKTRQEQFLDMQRPTDIDYDGKGSFYATSWSNGSFNYSGPNVGYLAKVSVTGFKGRADLDVAKLPDKELVYGFFTVVGPPGGMKARELAQREIVRRGPKPETVDAILDVLNTELKSPPPRFLECHATLLFTLKQLLGEKANPLLVQAFKGTAHAELREVALRALADKVGDKTAPLEPFVEGCKDKNPRVRLMAAWGLARLGRPEGIAAVLPLAGDDDALVQHVAVNTLVTLKAADACLGAVGPSNSKLTVGALRALGQMHDAKVVDGLAAKAKTLTDPATKSGVYRALARLHFQEAAWDGVAWWGTRPDTSGPYYKTAEWAGTAKVREILEAAIKSEPAEVVRGIAVYMQRNKIDSPAVAAYVANLAKTDPAFKAMLVEQLADGSAALNADQLALLKSTAVDEKADVAVRVKAVRALAKDAKNAAALDATVDAFAAIISAEKPPKELTDLMDETVRDAKYGSQVAYFAKTATTAEQPANREVAYAVLVSLADGKLTKADAKKSAAAAVEKGWESPKTAAPLLRAVGRTKASGYKDFVEALATDSNADVVRAAGYAAERLGLKGMKVADAASREAIEKVGYEKTLELALKEKGDAALGKELFTRVACIGCHTVSADEPPKGPFLGGITTRYSKAELVESIVKPNAKISQGFETQWFKLKDEEVYDGFVTRDAGDEVELRDAAGTVRVIKKADVVKQGKRETSIMPEGLVNKLSPAELASIIAYLETLKGK